MQKRAVDEMAEINRMIVAPTGDEIFSGLVRDLDSPELISQCLAVYPQAEAVRITPILDAEETIIKTLKTLEARNPDLIVLVGGSGGGHRFSRTLGKDYTHSALDKYLDEYSSHEIYGKNGHMWSKLIVGRKGGTVLINVPGPFVEAKAAFAAFLKGFREGRKLPELNRDMAEAVLALYPEQDLSHP